MTPLDLGAKCKGCPFAVKGFPARAVLGEGPRDPIGVFVGESPGRDEVDRKRPFVGATGQQLDESFITAKLPRAKLFVVNAICCSPNLGKSEADMRRAADRCRPALLAQLLKLKNVRQLPFFLAGKWAVYAMVGDARKWVQKQGFIQTTTIKKLKQINELTLAKLEKKRLAKKRKKKP